MVKLVFCLRRREGLSREEFQRIWLEEHGPLVRKHAGPLGIRRYVQVHTDETPFNQVVQESRGAPDAYDGVAELWWDSLEAMVEAGATEARLAAAAELTEDERRFIDHQRSPIFFAEEHVVVGEGA